VAVVGPPAREEHVINLLMRFHDPDEGAVAVDGIDLRTVTQASLREHVGLVLQEPFLFAGTMPTTSATGVSTPPGRGEAAAVLAGSIGSWVPSTTATTTRWASGAAV